VKARNNIFMKQFNFIILMSLILAGQVYAQQSQSITLDLSQPSIPQSFTLNEKNVWTETYNDVAYPFIEFNNSTFRFSHLGAGDGNSWGGYYWDGFTYSKNADNTDQGTNWYGNEWGNMAGGGIKTDENGNVLVDENGIVIADPEIPYLLAYWASYMEGEYRYPVLSVILNDTYRADGIYVNISPWAYFANINGDGYARPLNQNGDYFKLFIHAVDENFVDTGNTVEYFFAQNINGTLVQSPNWEWIDLSELGEIAGIYFTMESTDNDPVYGMNTASYFCVDKLKVHPREEVIHVTGVELNINTLEIEKDYSFQLIATILPHNATNQNISWDSSDDTIATVDENGLVLAIAKGETNIIVTTEDGNFTDVCVVKVTDEIGIDKIQNYVCNIYPTETTGLVCIILSEIVPDFVQIFDISGNLLQNVRLQSMVNCIDISSYASGIYMIKVRDEIVKVVKK